MLAMAVPGTAVLGVITKVSSRCYAHRIFAGPVWHGTYPGLLSLSCVRFPQEHVRLGQIN